MAESSSINSVIQLPALTPQPASAPPRVVPQPGGAGPLWRSLLFPVRGQRAVELGGATDLFASLRDVGVRFDRRTGVTEPAGVGDFDLVLEDLTRGRLPARGVRVRRLLSRGGRWVMALEARRCVGLAGRKLLRRARKDGFKTIETFYAYPSLRAPRMLVPLDSPEAFRYFLRLAVGVRAPRYRALALGANILCSLGLHRLLLSNLIVVARRTA